MKRVLMMMAVALALVACHTAATDSGFVTVRDGHFVRGGEPYYYVGTNFWYGAILGSEGQGGDRGRLCRELDALKEAGIDNLRILVGSDGERGVTTKVEPTLQIRPGVYNDTLLAGLDYLLMEMGKRQMVAVLYLNNAWEWSGGYGYYLEQAGCGKAPRPNEAGYEAYMRFVSQYAANDSAHHLFYDYVRFIVGRTNRYTGTKYTDDPAIMSWQIGNEPRAFSTEQLPAFEQWISEAAALLRSLDKNHLISIGSEGAWGCEGDYDVWQRICADPNVDYCNVHLWPYNWSWARRDSLAADLPKSCENTKEYIDRHLSICAQIGKPLVMEEFGYPRDGMAFQPGSPTVCRDSYYRFVFQMIADSKQEGGHFAGCNFWGWGGEARPRHQQWQVGDDYCGDPAQEEQGLNSVFLADASTMAVVSDYAALLSGNLTQRQQAIIRLRQLQQRGIMFGHQDDPFYGLTWSGIEDPQQPERGRSDVLETCGDYPAVMGFDLGGIEMGDEKNLDSVPFIRIREELVAHVERGGIVTVSWHPRNPLTGGTAWDVNDTTVVRSILPGGSQHEKFQLWMERVAAFLHSLKTDAGEPVPLIFRPWHENCGSWFWWGERLCSPEEFHALWCMLQDYLTGEGFDNLVWSYSPNFDGHCTESKILERYPGDSRVDLIGIDCYQWGREEDFVRDLNHDLAVLSGFAAERGKLVALTECGLKNLTDPMWWTRVLLPVVERYPLSYFHVWRNAKHEYFGPAPGEENAPYFNEMVRKDNILMLKDIAK